ncbi:hypothetical protein RHMOL_Rhmol11G0039800 [Rhododendron molle]|uniref:Uncharacterized protein n=1 Tax=Rhododendron molle TaxID=49168 RepID=A0ACC0LPY0_RHOML|nr:hypothetical protein RHMOL_Rhmol11G0039800 [Rhododendron molle]
MADHGDNSGDGDVVDRPEDRGGPMETQTEDQQLAEGTECTNAVVTESGGGGRDQQQEACDEEKHHAMEVDPRAMELAGAVGPRVEPSDLGMAVGGATVTGDSSGNPGGSGAMGDDLGPTGSPPRDSTRGKWAVIAEEKATEEERAHAIAASEAAERAEREQKEGEDLLRDAEAEERAEAEAQGPRLTAMAKAGGLKRP